MKISVVVIAKNEEHELPDCLESVAFADEIIVVDDESTDNTVAVATRHGAKVFRRKLEGFATQKNFGIDKAVNDWVLLLDADERLTPALACEIQALEPPEDISGYSMPFRNYLGDRWLRHGGLYPDRHVRLFRRSSARYGPREIHESLEFSGGNVAELTGDVVHLTYESASEYLAKVRSYSSRQATEDAGLGQDPGAWPLAVVREFLARYVKLGGVLDGWQGLVSATLLSYYQYLYRTSLKRAVPS